MSVQATPNPFANPSKHAKRRKRRGKIMEGLGTAAALLAIAVLAIVIISVAKRGLPALNVDFFTQNPAPFGQTGGGVKNSIIGTIIITAIATIIAVPVGVLVAIFTTEFAPPKIASGVRLLLNVMAGIPTIVIGVFIFGLLVVGRGQSAYAAGVALSIIMLPLVARATEEVLILVPSTLREGSMALGATRARTVTRVILPSAFGGILTGTIIGVARAAGETAPLLFTSSIVANTVVTDPHFPMSTLTLSIFENSEQPSAALQEQAWAAALVLMAVVLLGGIISRVLSARTRRQIEQAR